MSNPPKILVVDDNPDNVELLTKRLRAAGYRTAEAYDGEQALVTVAEEEPELVILDVMMPKLDGFEVCRRLKMAERTRYLPIIMLTAKREVPDKIKGLDTGADDYVTKPFNPQELMARVKSLLALRSSHEKRVTAEKLGALGQMAEGVAHEVRNPMVTIGGFARRIREKLPPGDPLRDYADHIIKEVERLETMVEEIVRFKTLLISPYETVDLRALSDEVLAGRARALEDAGVEVVRHYDPQVPVIEADGGNLRVALDNVVQNAVEAMEPGGRLTVEITAEGEWVRLEFADTGRGIPKSAIPSVFDPFYTSKMAGAGMGLTMVHRIVTRHGGEVDIASDEGQGTRVTLRLPLAQKKSI
ncbi:MAG: response regulator [Deltaproteobacteria bacterium]|nr:response regulator [Deltaproteobacteria bacterium]